MPQVTYIEAIRQALWEEMERDPRVFLIGEDIGVYGGAFKVTLGFQEEFGPWRVIDAPLSETAIVGGCTGAAIMGLRPVAEMQFADFVSCAFDQIVNQAATLRYRYGGRAAVPIVVRAPSGGNVGGGLYHSQNPEGWFAHVPGLKIVLYVFSRGRGFSLADMSPNARRFSVVDDCRTDVYSIDSRIVYVPFETLQRGECEVFYRGSVGQP